MYNLKLLKKTLIEEPTVELLELFDGLPLPSVGINAPLSNLNPIALVVSVILLLILARFIICIHLSRCFKVATLKTIIIRSQEK